MEKLDKVVVRMARYTTPRTYAAAAACSAGKHRLTDVAERVRTRIEAKRNGLVRLQLQSGLLVDEILGCETFITLEMGRRRLGVRQRCWRRWRQP